MSELNTFNLADLARQLNCHPNYLGRMIQRAAGKSFHQLLTEHRIEKAKPLLAVEHYSVTETALACGFSDTNYFSSVFRRVTGSTPSRYARIGPKHRLGDRTATFKIISHKKAQEEHKKY